MECGHRCGTDRHKRQADRTLLFEYMWTYGMVKFSEDPAQHSDSYKLCNEDIVVHITLSEFKPLVGYH